MFPVTLPVDPNEIVGTNGYMVVAEGDTVRWVSAEQSLPYTIYFENDPERATASALVVQVRLKLDPLMNPATLGIGSFGFNNMVFAVEGTPLQYQTRIDLVEQMGIYVDVVAGIDITTGEAFWIFSSIDPATGIAPTESDRGFLPVNDSTHRGEGFVNFTIKPRAAQCHTGDTIGAQASIVFDGNDAIETNRWLLTLDAQAPTSTMQVVHETADSLYIAFSGADDATGIAAYRLYYTEGGSAFRLAGRHPAGDTAHVATEPNTKYTFFSIGEDNVGNLEPMKDGPDTLYGNTQVQIAATVLPVGTATIVGTGTYAEGDTVRLALHAAEGYRLRRWVESGIPMGADTLLTFVAKEGRTLTAEMERISHTLTIAAAEGTTISTTRGGIPVFQSVQHGDSIDIHLATRPCTQATLLLNGQPVAADTTIVAMADISLSSVAEVAATDTVLLLDEICQGQDYSEHGFYISGSETSTLGQQEFYNIGVGANGCDSVTRLRLNVRPVYTIQFLANGGEGNMAPLEVCGNMAVLAVPTFVREGYRFVGWASDPAAAQPDYNAGSSIPVYADLMLYAVWQEGCVRPVSYRSLTVCDSTVWRGWTLFDSGEYFSDDGSSADGLCDTIYVLNLTVHHSARIDMQRAACAPYQWEDGLVSWGDTTRMFALQTAEGCDSTVTVSLTAWHSSETEEHIEACNSWQGYTGDTTLVTTHTTADGCDSVHTVVLTVNHGVATTESVVACDSWQGYTADTTLVTTHTTADGCDSVHTVVLTVNNSVATTESVTACDGWQGYTADTTLVTTHTTADGCDSVHTVVLTVNQSVVTTESVTACDSWQGYTADTTFVTTHTTADGCDSVHTVVLTISHSVATTEIVTACDSWQGYTADTTLVTTHNAADGCDSVHTVVLTISHSVATTESVAACDSWHGYTADTMLVSTHTAADGCDSVHTVVLTINHSVETTENVTVSEADLPIEYGGQTIADSGQYTIVFSTTEGCDSVVHLHVTVQQAGAAVAGEQLDISIHPNPTNGQITILADDVLHVDVLDLTGKVLISVENSNMVDLSSLPQGSYMLRIALQRGLLVQKVIKQ